MKFKALIFDLDGTLVDTLSDIADSMNAVLKRYNFPVHSVEDYRMFVGEGMNVLARRALPSHVNDNLELSKYVEEMKAQYAQNWMKTSKPYQGIYELLQKVRSSKICAAVFSNKPHQFTVAMIDHFFEHDIFSLVLGAGQFPPKPDPAGALFIAETFGINTKEICYVGDSGVDMQTAKSSGMFAVGVVWGFRGREELLSNGADVLVETPEDIYKLLQ